MNSEKNRPYINSSVSWHGDEKAVRRCKQCGGWIEYYSGKKITCRCEGDEQL